MIKVKSFLLMQNFTFEQFYIMRRITLIIFFWILHSVVFAQKNYVIFFETYEYNEKINDTITGHYPELLVINDSVSYVRPFKGEEKIKFKNREVGRDFQSHAEYYNFSTKKVVMQSHLAGKFKRIIYDTVKLYQWEVLDSTKYILGYKCTLATFKINDWEYEAWFTKDLPAYHSCTSMYKGLPGTTLECIYHQKNSKGKVLQKAIKIEKINIKIFEPTTGKVISDEEAQNILKEKDEELNRIYINVH